MKNKPKQKDAKKVIAGMIGGQVTSAAKAKAARENAKKGGRKKKPTLSKGILLSDLVARRSVS